MKAIYLLWPIRVPIWCLGYIVLGTCHAIGLEVDWQKYNADVETALLGTMRKLRKRATTLAPTLTLRWRSFGVFANFSQQVELNGHFIFQSTPDRAREMATRIQQALGLTGEIEELDRWSKLGDYQEQQR